MSGFLYSTPGFDIGQRMQAGLGHLQQGRLNEAWQAFSEVIAAAPDLAAAWHLRGLVLLQGGHPDEGIETLRKALALDPRDAVAHANLASALRDRGDYEEALAESEAALALDPDFGDALLHRANTLNDLARPAEAVAVYDRIIARQPGHVSAYNNRGNALRALGRLEDAAKSYEQALALEPARPEIQATSAFAYLGLGDYAQGLARFEARWQTPAMRAYLQGRGFTAPFWRGEEALTGRTLLLHSEQGFGDILQFCRYAPLAAARGARVIVEADAALAPLMRSLKGVDQVVVQGDPLPAFDLHCPMMSLPFAFGTTLDTIPGQTPYLFADPGKTAAWRARLGPGTRPRAGLCWSSGVRPDQPELKAINGRRNLPLAKLAALKGLEFDFVSLQKGQPAESEFASLDQGAWDGPPILDVAADLTDFSETAALISALDLVVSVDTSIPHLAGALGRPVWVMNRFDPCWRWLQDRTDSPWYPTARLFRQPAMGDWDSVLAEVRTALASL